MEPVAERSVLDAMPDFSTAPLERQRQQPQPGRREPEADSEARSGPSQVSFRLHSAALGRSPRTPNATVEDLSGSKEAIVTSALGWSTTPAAGVLIFASGQPSYLWSQIGTAMWQQILVAVHPVACPCLAKVPLPTLLTALICMEQALLGAGAIILAAIFAVTSFGGDGPSSSKRAPPSQQVASWPYPQLRQWCVQCLGPAVSSLTIGSPSMHAVGVAYILHCC